MNKKRYHIICSGRVQGVGFRYTAYHLAELYNLTGWVRNLYDGDVELEVQGDAANIDGFLHSLNDNDRWIRIDHLTKKERPIDDDEHRFKVRY